MKLRILAILLLLGVIIYSCKSKKASTPAESLEPGDAALKAIQTKDAGVTAETLKEGYAVYTGPCTNCHGKKNLYKHTDEEWQHDINRMSGRAKITDAQKDALSKYVLAMRMAKANSATAK
jgi:mono/diheme cytochrome c family protein